MNKIARFLMLDLLKSKSLWIYTVLLFVISWALLGLESSEVKATLSLLNVVLLVVPLVTIILSTIYVYNQGEFIELLLSQPVSRGKVWIHLYLGLALALCAAFLIGCALPIVLYSNITVGLSLIFSGLFLTLIFTSLALWCASLSRDKSIGIGLAIFVWLFFAVVYDGLLMVLMFQLAEYPIENFMATLSALNPIGLSRMFVLIQLDISAMLGHTGAIFQKVFGRGTGLVISLVILVLWVFIPLLNSLLKFRKKDL